jgi:hypothetical protein
MVCPCFENIIDCVQTRYYVPAWRASLREIQDEVFVAIDELNAMIAFERQNRGLARSSSSDSASAALSTPPSSTEIALMHMKVSLLVSVAIVTSRARLARARIRVLRLLLQNRLVFCTSDMVRRRVV